MYIISLTYKVPLENIDQYLESHVAYLNEKYEAGIFMMSGRKVPRTGGVILAKAENKKELLKIVEEDPFHINQLADYTVTEFIPSKTSKELQFLMD